uniref:UvrD-like helicase C-terminal domain-containing protein n=1 Tax=Octopus bimaculoides TaxID=37653 RepID=A0A0L8GM03_OCTBM
MTFFRADSRDIVPFHFKRLQFPVSLSFTMTINKSQGQTFLVVGLHPEEPCFTHGHLNNECSKV